MSYLGYRIKINGYVINRDMIAPGSFSALNAKRLVGSWTDADGKAHNTYYPDDKMFINFSLRERSVEEQETLVPMFAQTEDIPVEYWDDMTCTYKQGTFRMDRPTFEHLNEKDSLQYAETVINLEEY